MTAYLFLVDSNDWPRRDGRPPPPARSSSEIRRTSCQYFKVARRVHHRLGREWKLSKARSDELNIWGNWRVSRGGASLEKTHPAIRFLVVESNDRPRGTFIHLYTNSRSEPTRVFVMVTLHRLYWWLQGDCRWIVEVFGKRVTILSHWVTHSSSDSSVVILQILLSAFHPAGSVLL